MTKISDRPIYLNYVENVESDFVLKGIGYDNFAAEYIEPIKFLRMQNFYTLHIVLSGKGYLHFEDKYFVLKSGDMFFLTPDISFKYYPDKDEPWDYIWFAFDGKLSEIYAQKMGINSCDEIVECRDFGNAYLRIKNFLLTNKSMPNSKYYDALSFFYKVMDINIKTTDKRDYSYSEAIKSYIETYYHRADLKVEDIFTYFNISHSYMCKVFKNETGISVKEYILEYRISAACDLLKKTAMQVREIAFSVGFTDEVHFMKMFKSRMNASPKNFRFLNS